MKAYEIAKERFAQYGVDTEKVLAQLQDFHLSLHCWQADDVKGFEVQAGAMSGGIQSTGDFPGAARNIDELRQDIQSANPTAIVEHEATTSKISDEQLFYCNQRGLGPEDAVGLIVNGYAHEVLSRLPMEFAVEATKLLQVSLEGSVG